MSHRILHVAALPFPSPQGTQALLHHMLLAHQQVGVEAHLLCYAHGDGRPTPYPVHRVGDWPRLRSLRSGPSWLKPLLDVRLAASLRALCARLSPAMVIAHHVEAAACAAAVVEGPWVFYAHTDLGAELPTYLGETWGGLAHRAGASLDRWLVRHAPRVCAVSTPLAARLSESAGRPVDAPPLPWPLPELTTREARAQARDQLDLVVDDEVVLYAGNLDAYQGLETWLRGLRLLASRRPRLSWLLATASPLDAIRPRLSSLGLCDRVSVRPLTDVSRPQVHAAADVAVVPRLTPGGVPVKLLDALSRGLPVVAVRRAAAGLPLDELAWLVDDEPAALAQGVTEALDQPAERTRRRKLGRAYLAHRHSARGWASHPALCPVSLRVPAQVGGFSDSGSRQW